MYTTWKPKILLCCKLHWGLSCVLGEVEKPKKPTKAFMRKYPYSLQQDGFNLFIFTIAWYQIYHSLSYVDLLTYPNG